MAEGEDASSNSLISHGESATTPAHSQAFPRMRSLTLFKTMAGRRAVDFMVIGREECGRVQRLMLGSVELRRLHDAGCYIYVVGRPPRGA